MRKRISGFTSEKEGSAFLTMVIYQSYNDKMFFLNEAYETSDQTPLS